MERAVLYVRRSSNEPRYARREDQRAGLLAHAQARGYRVVEEAEDRCAPTVRPDRRVGLGRLLALLDRRGAERLLVWSMAELAMRSFDAASVIQRGKERGWALDLVVEDIRTCTAAGRYCATVVAASREWQFEERSTRRMGRRGRGALSRKRTDAAGTEKQKTTAEGCPLLLPCAEGGPEAEGGAETATFPGGRGVAETRPEFFFGEVASPDQVSDA